MTEQIIQPVQPEDPLFDSQWHLFKGTTAAVDINVSNVWQDYTGKGVLVGVIEDAVQWDHPDLIDNYDPLLDFDAVRNSAEVSPNGANSHATAVAGLIGAAANGEGVVGVAYDATVVSYEAEFTSSFFAAFDRAMDVTVNGKAELGIDRGADIINNSWAFTSPFAGSFNSIFAELQNMGDAIEEAAQFGRDGLGTVMLWAAGNERGSSSGQWANGSNLTNSPYTIAVGAIDAEGDYASYSNPGANLLISAPSSGGSFAITTTTTGSGYTLGFGGTSAATPIVTGVTALMLEANPELGFRDIQDVLALSAHHADLRDLRQPDDQVDWTVNASKSWNGGGLLHSNDFGFGLVDAHAAVRLAESWEKTQTYGDQQIVAGTHQQGYVSFDAGTSPVVASIDIAGSFAVEHAEVMLDLSHSRAKDLLIELVAPSGTRSVLMDGNGGNSFYPGNSFTLSSAVFRGEDSAGTWRIEITDQVAGSSGNFGGWSLTLYGKDTADSLADVFVFTDEYSDYAFAEPSRLTLKDDDGGIDTLNASPVTSDSYIDLGGNFSLIDYVVLTIDESIENAVGGDGNDTLLGHDGSNTLSGGRGADVLFGFGGEDTLNGGFGNDQIFDGDDDDSIEGGAGDDTLRVGDGFDLVDGGDGVDTLIFAVVEDEGVALDLSFGFGFSGAAKGDRYARIENVVGTDLEDDISGDNSANRLEGLAGNDTLDGGWGDDTLLGGSGSDSLEGAQGNDLLDGGEGNDELAGDAGEDELRGGAGADLISGGAGDDTLKGADGDDTLVGGAGGDVFDGGAGFDVVSYASSDERVTVRLDDSTKNAGDALGDSYSSIEAIFGTDYDDYLRGSYESGEEFRGGDGNDVFLGLGGANSLFGGEGNDRFYSGTGGDLIDGGEGNDTAHYNSSSQAVSIDLLSGQGNFGSAEGDRLSSIEIVFASAFDDTISGDAAGNWFYGHSGNDLLAGLSGNDWLFGLDGDDTLLGGEGSDYLDGGAGKDYIDGGHGIDLVYYISSTEAVSVDLLSGQGRFGLAEGDVLSGIEIVSGSSFDDTLSGDASGNKFYGQNGNDVLAGLEGSDWLSGNNGDDTLLGGEGSDYLGGGAGSDFIDGGAGHDIIIAGGEGADSLYGGEGGDRFYSGTGGDLIDGGEGIDSAHFDLSSVAVLIDLDAGFGAGGLAEGDSFSSIENVSGSMFNDTLIGDASDNLFYAKLGDDLLRGMDGNDLLYAHAGDDTLEGGVGRDRLEGGYGFDIASYENASTAVVADLQAPWLNTGEASGDTFRSVEGIRGSAYEDALFGDDSDNVLEGLDGDDILQGRGGDDTLSGGLGADLFVWQAGDGSDSIVDFDPLADLLDLRTWGGTSFSELNVVDGVNGAEVSFNTEDKLVLFGVEALAIEDSWALWS